MSWSSFPSSLACNFQSAGMAVQLPIQRRDHARVKIWGATKNSPSAAPKTRRVCCPTRRPWSGESYHGHQSTAQSHSLSVSGRNSPVCWGPTSAVSVGVGNWTEAIHSMRCKSPTRPPMTAGATGTTQHRTEDILCMTRQTGSEGSEGARK